MKIRSVFLNSVSLMSLILMSNVAVASQELPDLHGQDVVIGGDSGYKDVYINDETKGPFNSLTIQQGGKVAYDRDTESLAVPDYRPEFDITDNLQVKGMGSLLNVNGGKNGTGVLNVGKEFVISDAAIVNINSPEQETSPKGTAWDTVITVGDTLTMKNTGTFNIYDASVHVTGSAEGTKGVLIDNGKLELKSPTNNELVQGRTQLVMDAGAIGDFVMKSGDIMVEQGDIIRKADEGNMKIGLEPGTPEAGKVYVSLTDATMGLTGTTGEFRVDNGQLILDKAQIGNLNNLDSASPISGKIDVVINNADVKANKSSLITNGKTEGNITFNNTHIVLGMDKSQIDNSSILQEGSGNLTFTNGKKDKGKQYALYAGGNSQIGITSSEGGNLTLNDALLTEEAQIIHKGKGITLLENIGLEDSTSINIGSISADMGTFTLNGGKVLDNASISFKTHNASDMIITGDKVGFVLGGKSGKDSASRRKASLTYIGDGELFLQGGNITLGNDVPTVETDEDGKETVKSENTALITLKDQDKSFIAIDGVDTVVNLQNVDVKYQNEDPALLKNLEGPVLNLRLNEGTLNLGDMKTLNVNHLINGEGEFTINGDFRLNILKDAEINGHLIAKSVDFEIKEDTENVTFGAASHLDVNGFKIGKSFSMNDLSVVKTLDVGKYTLSLHDLHLGNGAVVSMHVPKDSTNASGTIVGGYGQIKAHSVTVGDTLTDKATIKITLDKWLDVQQKGTLFQFITTETAFNSDQFNVINDKYTFEAVTCEGTNGLCYLVKYGKDGAELAQKAGADKNQTEIAGAYLDGQKFQEGSKIAQFADALDRLSQQISDEKHKKTFLDALSLIAPDTTGITRQTTITDHNMVLQTISNRLGNPNFHVYSNMSSGDAFFNSGFWSQVLYSEIDKANEEKGKMEIQNGFKGKTIGGAFGIDAQVADTMMVGAGYSYTAADIDNDAKTRNIEMKNHTGFVYAKYQPNDFFFNVIGTYSMGTNDIKKSMVMPLPDEAGKPASYTLDDKSSYDTTSYSGQIMIGYDFPGLNLTPTIGGRYLKLEQDAYTDSYGQEIDKSTSDFATAVAEVTYNATYQFSRRTHVMLSVKAGGTYDVKTTENETYVQLPNGSSYTVEGDEIDRAAMTAGIGVTMEIDGNFELSASFDHEQRSDYHANTFSAKAKLYF